MRLQNALIVPPPLVPHSGINTGISAVREALAVNRHIVRQSNRDLRGLDLSNALETLERERVELVNTIRLLAPYETAE